MRYINVLRIAPCLLAILVDSLGYGLVYPIITTIFTNVKTSAYFGLNTEQLRDFYLGLGFLLYPLFMFFGASFLGDLSDSLGRKKVILVCTGGLFVSFLLMGLGIAYSILWLFMIGRAFSGLMAGSQPISQAAIADLTTHENKAMNMSLVTLTICIGMIIGPVIAGIFSDKELAKDFNYYTPFIVSAFLALIAFVWISISFKETFKIDRSKKIEWSRPIKIFVQAFVHPKILFLSLIFFLFQVGFGLYFQMILIHLIKTFHYRSINLGIFYAYLGVFFALGLLIIVPYALRKWRIETCAIISLAIVGFCQIASAFHDSEILLWILVIPLAMSNVLAYTTLLTSFSNAADKTEQGWVMGVFASVVAISFILVGLSTNLLNYFSTDLLIFFGGVLSILSALLMETFHYKNKKANAIKNNNSHK